MRCWRDEKQMLLGDDIYEQVDRGIRLWDKVLLCCSRHSNQTGAGRGRTIPLFRQRQAKGWGTRLRDMCATGRSSLKETQDIDAPRLSKRYILAAH